MRTIETAQSGSVTSSPSAVPEGQGELGCPACPHPLSVHDVIGHRYCSATAAGALSRGCVCVGDAENTPGTTPETAQNPSTDKETR